MAFSLTHQQSVAPFFFWMMPDAAMKMAVFACAGSLTSASRQCRGSFCVNSRLPSSVVVCGGAFPGHTESEHFASIATPVPHSVRHAPLPVSGVSEWGHSSRFSSDSSIVVCHLARCVTWRCRTCVACHVEAVCHVGINRPAAARPAVLG